jgi:hypothetical protein
MNALFENYSGDTSAKDGGFVFQAIVSNSVSWSIKNGETLIDPKRIFCKLHQIDVFPDIKIESGSASLTYVILSEVNILKRKFELASEAIKKRIFPEYAEALQTEIKSSDDLRKINDQFFNNTFFDVELTTDHLVLREVSSSGLDSGAPAITLKISTGMVDNLDGESIETWGKFKIQIDGSTKFEITNDVERISQIIEYDSVERTDDIIFRTIIPSLSLEFKGEKVLIDTYTNRSSNVASIVDTDYDNLFDIGEDNRNDSQDSDDADK